MVEEESEGDEENKDDIKRISSVQGATIKTHLGGDDVIDKEARKNQLLKLKQGERIDNNNVNGKTTQGKRNGNREQQPFQSILTQTKI